MPGARGGLVGPRSAGSRGGPEAGRAGEQARGRDGDPGAVPAAAPSRTASRAAVRAAGGRPGRRPRWGSWWAGAADRGTSREASLVSRPVRVAERRPSRQSLPASETLRNPRARARSGHRGGVPSWGSGAVAQLVAHLVRNEGVRGSSPLSSTQVTAPPGAAAGQGLARRSQHTVSSGARGTAMGGDELADPLVVVVGRVDVAVEGCRRALGGGREHEVEGVDVLLPRPTHSPQCSPGPPSRPTRARYGAGRRAAADVRLDPRSINSGPER